MYYFLILFPLLFSKIFGISNIYNILFIPCLSFLFLSRSSKAFNKKLSLLIFSIFTIVVFSFLVLGGDPLPFSVALLRSFSISTVFLSILGLLPFNESLFNHFRWPIILSFPAILFLFNPPPIYSILGYASDRNISPGIFDAYSLVGIFPTSFYLSQLLSAVLIYKISPIFRQYDFKILPFVNENIDRIILILALVLTNRKVFLILLLFYPISSLIKSMITIFKKLRIRKEIFNNLVLRLILISAIFAVFAFGLPNFSFSSLLDQILERLQYYTQYAFAPWSESFAETGMMVIYKYGGTFLFIITWFMLLGSFIYSLYKFRLSKISDFLIAYTLIILLLFKEAATIFSPSPSSLVLLMVISMLINSSRSSETRIETK